MTWNASLFHYASTSQDNDNCAWLPVTTYPTYSHYGCPSWPVKTCPLAPDAVAESFPCTRMS